MCFVEQKTFSVLLRIFLTNEPPLWFPLYFGLQKCWRWQFLLKIVDKIVERIIWHKNIFCDIKYFPHKCAFDLFTDLKVIIMFVFVVTENIFCDITYFPHNCATFVVSFVFWFTKFDVDNFYSKSLTSIAKIFIQI